jgi:hypothetical protein
MYREAVREELDVDRAFREDRIVWRRQLSEVRAAERHRVLRAILADTTTTNGKVGQPRQSKLLEGVNPDDGGFLPLARTGGPPRAAQPPSQKV